MEKLFNELFTQIERLKAHERLSDPRRRDGSYSRLDMAAYHLATCKNLLETISKSSGRNPAPRNVFCGVPARSQTRRQPSRC